ncbi:MAG: Uma2 family endonuclease [Pirellulales bacterium]
MSIHEPLQVPLETSEQPPYRFSVEQYEQMIAGGILGENDRVQLVDGAIIEMAPIGPAHRAAVQNAARSLGQLLPAGWELMIQQPLSLATSVPEPDLAVVRSPAAKNPNQHPGGSDVGLVIEVSDTTLRLDRGDKLHIYAAGGIPEYWIINLLSRQIEVHRDPLVQPGSATSDYRLRQLVPHGAAVPLTLDGRTLGDIPVADLLP